MNQILRTTLPVAMLVAAASADMKYYEGYGAPVVGSDGAVIGAAKLGLGLERTQDGTKYPTAQDLTVVFENIATDGELKGIYSHVLTCIEIFNDKEEAGTWYTCH